MRNYFKIIGLCSLTLALASCGSKYSKKELSAANSYCSCYADAASQKVAIVDWYTENYDELKKMNGEVDENKNVDYSESEMLAEGLEMHEEFLHTKSVAKEVCFEGFKLNKGYESNNSPIGKEVCPETVYAMGKMSLSMTVGSDEAKFETLLKKLRDHEYVSKEE